MKLADLSAAWNRLRDRALGRAASPSSKISPELAQRIGDEFNAWRTWYLSAGSLEDVAASVAAHEWVSRYNVLAAELTAEGIATSPVATAVESGKKAARAAAHVADQVITFDLPIALLLAAAWYFGSKRR